MIELGSRTPMVVEVEERTAIPFELKIRTLMALEVANRTQAVPEIEYRTPENPARDHPALPSTASQSAQLLPKDLDPSPEAGSLLFVHRSSSSTVISPSRKPRCRVFGFGLAPGRAGLDRLRLGAARLFRCFGAL